MITKNDYKLNKIEYIVFKGNDLICFNHIDEDRYIILKGRRILKVFKHDNCIGCFYCKKPIVTSYNTTYRVEKLKFKREYCAK